MVVAAGAIWREVSGREMEREAGRMLLVVVGTYLKEKFVILLKNLLHDSFSE